MGSKKGFRKIAREMEGEREACYAPVRWREREREIEGGVGVRDGRAKI